MLSFFSNRPIRPPFFLSVFLFSGVQIAVSEAPLLNKAEELYRSK